jgi:hypothetical protein
VSHEDEIERLALRVLETLERVLHSLERFLNRLGEEHKTVPAVKAIGVKVS